jgi:hypothetical protein
MKHKHTLKTPPVPEAVTTEDESSRVVARPDGFYWVADDGRQEFGPFPSAALALAALREGISTHEEGESVVEAEAEIGIAEWVDPETGQPAEEVITRLEDH